MMTSSLRQRMTHDLQLAGLSGRTQEAYLRAGRQLADHFHTPPDRLTETQLRDDFLHLKSPARGRVRADVGLSEPSPSEGVRKRYPCGPHCGGATGFLNRDWRSGFADSNPLWLGPHSSGTWRSRQILLTRYS